MATNLIDLTADIVCAHLSVTGMSSEDLLQEIQEVYATLEALEQGVKPVELKKSVRKGQGSADMPAEQVEEKPAGPVLSIEEAFKPDRIACMICGKTGMKTLKRHLGNAHSMKPGQYKKMFNIPKELPLSAPEYVAQRRQAALDKGLGEKLVAARAKRKATAKKKAKK